MSSSKRRYTELPLKRMAVDIRLSAVAFQVLCALDLAPRIDDAHVMSLKDLMTATGRSKNAVRQALAHLIDAGYLHIDLVYERNQFFPERHYTILGG